MHVTYTPEEQEFRREVRQFLEQKYPEDIARKQNSGIALAREDHVRWQKILHKQGWIAPNWPQEYGGTGWSVIQKHIFEQQLALFNAPRVIPFGLSMVGPVIYTYGSDEQKQRFLPDILASDTWWCQGYSEPGAGSDLASLKTRADLDGDHYVVNGTKTWTTLAQHADWIFLLVRTTQDTARRQEGISFLLCDMTTPGVSVRPIITLEGSHEVNEVHFEDVRVPANNLVGEEGRGWTYGKVLLQHERTNIAGVAASQYRLDRLIEQARSSVRGEPPLIEDADFCRRLKQTQVELRALEYTELRTLAAVATGKAPGPESSILKIKGTEMQQRIDTLIMDAAGYYALPFVPEQFTGDGNPAYRVGQGNEARSALKYFNFRKATIYGGSNEIQRNIVAKHVLGL